MMAKSRTKKTPVPTHGLVCSNPGCRFVQSRPIPKEGDPCVWCGVGHWVKGEKK